MVLYTLSPYRIAYHKKQIYIPRLVNGQEPLLYVDTRQYAIPDRYSNNRKINKKERYCSKKTM